MDLATASRFHLDRLTDRPPAWLELVSVAGLLVVLLGVLVATGAGDRLDLASTASWRWVHALVVLA